MNTHDRIEGDLDDMGLPSFIRRWNSHSGGAKIASYDNLLKALSYDKRLDAAFDEARLREIGAGCHDYDGHVMSILEPVINSSFLLSMLRVADDFARRAIDMSPADLELAGPFASVDDWAEWVLRNVDLPWDFCGPMGETILEDDAIETLLGRSLRAVHPAAIEAGWILGPDGRSDRLDGAGPSWAGSEDVVH